MHNQVWCMSGLMRHGMAMCNKQYYKLSGAQYATRCILSSTLTCNIVCCTLPCHASLNRTCIILVCASWHVYACVFTMLYASFWLASLVSFGFVLKLWAFVRLLPFLWLLHGLVLLPSGISGKMTVTLDLITIIAMLVASFFRYDALPITCFSSLPNCHVSL